MKKLILIIIIILTGCMSQKDISYKDSLYLTRKYVGDFIEMVPGKRITEIVTTRESFYILGKPELDIHKGVRCYVKYYPEKIANSMTTYFVLYFTWNGTRDMYVVRQDWITGRIY